MLKLFLEKLIFGFWLLIICECKMNMAVKQSTITTPTQKSLQCGGIANGFRGTISYKLFQFIQPNERCVWILRPPRVTAVDIQLHKLDAPEYGFLKFIAFGLGTEQKYWIPNGPLNYSFNNTNVLVVTFATQHWSIRQRDWRGFSFSYSFAITGGVVVPSNTSTDVLLTGEYGLQKYPIEQPNSNAVTNYGNYDLSTFVFLPACNSFHPDREIGIIYKELYMERILDKVDVFVFNNGYYGWDFVGSIRGGEQEHHIVHNDLIMLVFRSDGSIVGPGFHMAYRNELPHPCAISGKNSVTRINPFKYIFNLNH